MNYAVFIKESHPKKNAFCIAFTFFHHDAFLVADCVAKENLKVSIRDVTDLWPNVPNYCAWSKLPGKEVITYDN